MKTIIIQSVGRATPSVAKAIADSFEINLELLTRMLYNAPSVFLENADDVVAEKTSSLLEKLGLEIICQDASLPIPEKSPPIDIAVYVSNPLALPKVAKQLSEFIGCKESEALNLLLNEPSVVLGGVSLATAKSLEKRLDAEVIASNPKTDLYSILVDSEDPAFLSQFFLSLKAVNVKFTDQKSKEIRDLSYTKAQEIWNRYHNSKKIKVVNQAYQRYQILLNKFDLMNDAQRAFLINEVGMPEEALPEIHANLPVILEESINSTERSIQLQKYQDLGLICEATPLSFEPYKLTINEILDTEKVQKIVNQFYKDVVLTAKTTKWVAPAPISNVLNRYLEKQLEMIGCEIERQY
jgi:hypothetical protein